MKKLIKFISSFLLTLIILLVFEGACFRLVEKYAELRHRVAWGVPGNGGFNPLLKILPLDHFAVDPSLTPVPGQSAYETASEESDYAESVMSFSRPLRDRYEDYLENEFDPLANFEIRDFGPITGIVLPGLKRAANPEEVNQKMARRVGDELEYSKGILIRIISSMEAEDYETEFSNLESSFGFVLKKGIACLVLPVQDADDILNKIDYLQTHEELLSKNVFVWGDGRAAGYVLEASRKNPEKIKAILLSDPKGVPLPPEMVGLPWLTLHLSEETISEGESVSDLLQWVRIGRISEKIYPSRLGGLLRLEELSETSRMPSFFVASLFQCSDYIDHAGSQWPNPKPLINGQVAKETNLKQNQEGGIEEKKPFDVEVAKEKIREISKENEKAVKAEDATFDCEIVRGYRELRQNDEKLRQVSNRDLVLLLGLEFEKMGGGVMDQVLEKDPVFHGYYFSLKALGDSPLY
ncbi:MAG: hypothetical protein HN531_09690 [Opitutae bacterium]|nr:hypothetical protein [Opitutae bacterium]